jgi:hypothetical protein
MSEGVLEISAVRRPRPRPTKAVKSFLKMCYYQSLDSAIGYLKNVLLPVLRLCHRLTKKCVITSP